MQGRPVFIAKSNQAAQPSLHDLSGKSFYPAQSTCDRVEQTHCQTERETCLLSPWCMTVSGMPGRADSLRVQASIDSGADLAV
jgi:hypothetical protein